jgi:hypothetical protein
VLLFVRYYKITLITLFQTFDGLKIFLQPTMTEMTQSPRQRGVVRLHMPYSNKRDAAVDLDLELCEMATCA